jgi:ABC-type multidrug transport system fused ATPase/permease subunit
MFSTNRELALTMLPLLLVTSAIIVVFSTRMEPLFLSVQQKLDRLNTILQENIAGERLVSFCTLTSERSSKMPTGSHRPQCEGNDLHVSNVTPDIFVNIGIVSHLFRAAGYQGR